MIRKQKCNQTDGDSGTYVLSYTDKSGRKHRNCHTSKKKAKSQIAAIEIGESIEMEHSLKEILHEWVRNVMQELLESNDDSSPKRKNCILK
jgi:hypothetical protein